MFLNAWNVNSDVVIHRKGCSHRKPKDADQVEFGEQDFLSKHAFAYDYWNNGILSEHEAEHGEGSFDVWQGMQFMNCTDALQEREPEPPAKGKKKTAANGKPKSERVTGYRQWAVKPVTSAMVGFTAWIAEAYPELKVDPTSERDMRLVMIASKAYSYFQASEENARRNGKAAA